MGFIRTFLSSCLGALTAMIMFAILVIAVIAGMTGEKEAVIKNNSVLHLSLDVQINELEVEDPFSGLPFPGVGEGNIGLMQLLSTIEHAADDNKIQGIYLETAYPMASPATLEEIRLALLDFRKSGKWVIAYDETMSEGAYYLSSAADEVYLNPEGRLEFNGLTVTFASFKKLFDKLEIKPQIFRVGEFKSAVEPFIQEKMSDENRLQLRSMINSMHGVMLDRISSSRGIPVEELREVADKNLVRIPEDAVAYGLVDSLLYTDEFERMLMTRVGVESRKDLSLVKYKRYRESFTSGQASGNEIAVIIAEGTIMPGESEGQTQPMVGADTYVDAIRRARTSDRVKAILLRINSPGGEYQSSDRIWREIRLAAQSKPVIASMGDYAASGGYYIAMACDTIVAQPQTVTGSIGIFGMMFDMSNFFDHKLGITFEEVKTGESGELFTFTRPLTQAEKEYWQKTLDENYEEFLEKAAQGRRMDKEEIRSLAAGRVWTGEEAVANGLVDVLGGFDEAVALATKAAGVEDDYRLRFYPERKSILELWLSRAKEEARADAMKSEMGELHHWYGQLKQLSEFQGAQARLPFKLTLE
ncbi:MAG TPA: signal peptide peptidase SppA [Cyclobacteriaceae bacterium]|nr:signal peptide peptidase SppA [Cyclobacteriaceae bacterium]